MPETRFATTLIVCLKAGVALLVSAPHCAPEPLDRVRELATAGVLGGVAPTHYSFMGAGMPQPMEPYAREVAERLKSDHVDAVVLTPV